jgi:hypothetical protein
MFCIQYSGWDITHTPRECAGLTRVFAVQGLDKSFGPNSSGVQDAGAMSAGILLRDYFAADLGLDAEPCTMRSLSTLNAPGAELACIPAMAESVSFKTTP